MPDAAPPVLLELDAVSKSFGKVVVADRLSLTVGAGDVLGMVGPNGAGKTSVFGLISGTLEPSAGEIRFAGTAVTRMRAPDRCRLGIGRTFQVPRPFGNMTVFENVLVAVQQGSRPAAAGQLRRGGAGAEPYRAARPGQRAGRAARPAPAQAAGAGPGAGRRGRGCCCSMRWPAG